MESCHSSVHSSVGAFVNGMDGMNLFIISMYFYLVSKNWVYIQSFFFILTVLMTGIAWTLPESPKWLVSMGR